VEQLRPDFWRIQVLRLPLLDWEAGPLPPLLSCLFARSAPTAVYTRRIVLHTCRILLLGLATRSLTECTYS
jgi:hypothetical protein